MFQVACGVLVSMIGSLTVLLQLIVKIFLCVFTIEPRYCSRHFFKLIVINLQGLVQVSTWTKDCQRLLANIATLFSALFKPRVCQVRQPAMSPTDIATSLGKMGRSLGLAWGVAPNFSSGRMLLLVQVGLVRATCKFEATYDELNNTCNGLIMWKHFGRVGVSMFRLCLCACLNHDF